jgi:hypothetical protein
MNRRDNTIKYILDRLPETERLKLYQYDPAVHAFVMLMAEKESFEDLFSVIDQMFTHYTRIIRHQQDQLDIILPRLSYEEIRRLNHLMDAKSAEITDPKLLRSDVDRLSNQQRSTNQETKE